MKRLTFILFSLVFTLIVFSDSFGQTDKDKSGNQSVHTQSDNMQSLQNIQQWVVGISDEKISALALAQIADLSWKADENYARGLFRFSINKLTIGQNDSTKEVSLKTSAHRRVISLIAKHDPIWAKMLVESLTKDSGKKAWANMEIAGDLLESDSGRAVDFAAQSIQNEITPGLVTFLKSLRQRNADEANRLFLQILSRYPLQTNIDANQFAILGTYIFTSPHIDPSDFQSMIMVRVGNIGMPDFTANQPDVPIALIHNYIRGAVSLMNRLSNDSEQRTVKYALGYILVPKAQEFAPNLVGDLLGAMASLAASVPPEYTTEAAYKYVGMKPGPPEDRIKEIEKMADSYTRDQLFLDLVFQAYRRHDFEIAKLATSKIDNKNLQDELENLILFGEANELLKGKKVDFTKAAQMIGKLPGGLEKNLLQLAFASVADKSKNKAIEEEMLGLARDSAKILNNEFTPFILMYICGQLKENADPQSSTVLAEAVKAFNKFDTIKDPLLVHKVTLEPLTLPFSLTVKDVNLGFPTSFLNAVTGDEENAVLMVNDIKDERLKGLAYVSLAKLILAEKPVPGTQEKVVKVGEDGIRKSAAKIVMPIYPAASLKNKVEGVAVAEVQYNGEGAVTDVKILESPDSLTGQSVTYAMKLWKFSPSQLEGKPISVRGKITFYFAINEKGKGEVKNPKQFQ